jgi:hypothetical protein
VLGFVRVLGFTRQNVGIRVWWQCFVFFHHALIKLRVSILDTTSIPFTSKAHRSCRNRKSRQIRVWHWALYHTSPNWYSHPLCPSVQFHVLKTGRHIKLGFAIRVWRFTGLRAFGFLKEKKMEWRRATGARDWGGR